MPVSDSTQRRVVLLLYNAQSDAFSPQELLDRQLTYVSALKDLAGDKFVQPVILASGLGNLDYDSKNLIDLKIIPSKSTHTAPPISCHLG